MVCLHTCEKCGATIINDNLHECLKPSTEEERFEEIKHFLKELDRFERKSRESQILIK